MQAQGVVEQDSLEGYEELWERETCETKDYMEIGDFIEQPVGAVRIVFVEVSIGSSIVMVQCGTQAPGE